MLKLFALRESSVNPNESVFLPLGVMASSVTELFKNIASVTEKIPQKFKNSNGIPVDIHYTLGTCASAEPSERVYSQQDLIPIDIDNIFVGKEIEYIEAVVSTLKIDPKKTGIVFSGNGLHFLIQAETPWDMAHFSKTRQSYKAMKMLLERVFDQKGLLCKEKGKETDVDMMSWTPNKTFRMPETFNSKRGRLAKVLAGRIEPQAFSIMAFDESTIGDFLPPETTKKLTQFIDAEGVLTCPFIEWCKNNQSQVLEPQWYAMLSILAHMREGKRLCHEYSRLHPKYTENETDTKYSHALNSARPRTCAHISTLWKGCATCPQLGQVKSPILIQGPNFIPTQNTGFHTVKVDKNGNIKYTPNYLDLLKYYERSTSFVVSDGSKDVYNWVDTHWVERPHIYLDSFAQMNFDPPADIRKRAEFTKLALCSNLRKEEWFSDTERRTNLGNGVFNANTLSISPHSKDLGFRFVLPYNYDPTATCPRFEKFLQEVTIGRDDIATLLLEFMGYTIFADPPEWGEKVLILLGDGSNGKSVFVDTLKALVGKENFSSLGLKDLESDLHRSTLTRALVNISEESPSTRMFDSETLKSIASGGNITSRVLYKGAFSVKAKAKCVICANTLPLIQDATHGFARKLLIVPFDQLFDDVKGMKKDRDLRQKLKEELPGIFNLIVKSYRELHARGSFIECASVTSAVNAYATEISSEKQWLEEVDEGETGTSIISSEEAYAHYVIFCRDCGIKPNSKVGFSRVLAKSLDDKRKKRSNSKTTYIGLNIKNSSAVSY